MNKVHLVWDLDGTLINSEKDVFLSLEAAVSAVGLSKKDQIAPFRLGPTIDKILDSSFPESKITVDKKTAIIKGFRDIYDNCGFNNTALVDGVEQILRDNRFEHHILTNKPDLATKFIIKKLGLDDCFCTIITPYTFEKKLTKTELFAYLKSLYPFEHFIGIGDMDTDCRAAKDNGIASVGVLWGTGTRRELISCGCDIIVGTIAELKSKLEEMI